MRPNKPNWHLAVALVVGAIIFSAKMAISGGIFSLLDEGPVIQSEAPYGYATNSLCLKEGGLAETFSALTYSKRKEFARQVAEAKTKETCDKRIQKVLEALR